MKVTTRQPHKTQGTRPPYVRAAFGLLAGAVYPLLVLSDLGGAQTEHLHLVASAVVLGVLASGLLALIRPRTRRTGATITAVFTAASATVALLVGNPDNHGGQAGWVDPAFLILLVPLIAASLAGGRDREPEQPSTPAGRPRSRILLVLSAVPFLIAFGVQQALTQRSSWPPVSDPHHNGHWHVVALAAMLLAGLVVLSALRRTGWQLPTRLAAVSSVAAGLSALAWPGDASSPARSWGVAAVVWGVSALLVTTPHRSPWARHAEG